jgi:dihydropteroate synthase
MSPKQWILECGNYKLDLGERTHVMGVVNLTPDSFSGDGIYRNPQAALKKAAQLEADGADILDLGGESTRPGACEIELKEEIARVIPALKRIIKKVKIPISIDTRKYQVAKAALDNGACLINDVSALKFDQRLAKLAKEYKAALILMHARQTPQTMQQEPFYENLLAEMSKELKESIKIALRAGVKKQKIIIDPGIGFAKTLGHNLEIIKNLSLLTKLGFPILIGTSRKSFIGKILHLEAQERIFGTAASLALAIANGAKIVRVHEVKPMVQVARMCDAIIRA